MADICNMTRKTRTRQSRIHAALQSGYCAICHIPYNSLADHIQSKKHLKLIGEDANYISINGFIDQNSLEPFLNLNGIDSIDVNGRHIEKDFCTRTTRNNRRGMSMDRLTGSPMESPIHHHLRSRKQINYAMSPSMDEDSFGERPDLMVRPSTKEKKNQKQIVAKKPVELSEQQPNEEVWNSGRPKRKSCLRSKRTSADEKLVVDNKTYYKVEVMTTKLRSSSAVKEEHHEVKPCPETQENERDEKGLIVKFKKLRNSEITLLNNEAENFLFPKKDDSSSSEEEEEDIDADCPNATLSSCEDRNDSYLPSSDNEDDKTNDNYRTEDEASMDSSTSSSRSKKRRRTHAEAFIMDNQKYYKFETPGSRLRYHGSFFSEPNLKSPKHNGNMDIIKVEKKEVVEEAKPTPKNKYVDLDNYKFSFEMVPSGEKWFEPFRRQDLGEESYMYLPDVGSENRFIMPYQISAIPPLDPKICIAQYSQLKKMVQEQSSRTSCSTPDRSDTNYTPSLDNDEDSKSSEPTNSIEFYSENSNLEEFKSTDEKCQRKRELHVGKNPRKSPRQHASTLAILSSLIHQRKKKLKAANSNSEPPGGSTTTTTNPVPSKSTTLPTIPEEAPLAPTTSKANPVDYEDILVSMNQEMDADKLCEDLDMSSVEPVEFSNKLGILDVLRIYDMMRTKDDYRSNRRFISGSPVPKSGRRKKINKTGWPNRKKFLNKKDTSVKEETSSLGSANDSETEEQNTSCTDLNKTDVSVNNCDSSRVQHNLKTPKSAGKLKVSTVSKNVDLQPIVKVKKLDSVSKNVNKDDESAVNKRTNRRRMPASPKSPRLLRKPRGRWYKER